MLTKALVWVCFDLFQFQFSILNFLLNPVDTRRRFNVDTTSYRRWSDVMRLQRVFSKALIVDFAVLAQAAMSHSLHKKIEVFH